MQTIWVIHAHFADLASTPLREQRLAWYQRGKKDDRSGAPLTREDGKDENPPWMNALGIEDRVRQIMNRKQVQKELPTADSKYFEKNRNALLQWLYEGNRSELSEIIKVQKSIDRGDPAEKIRFLIEETMNPKENPEQNKVLQEAIAQSRPERKDEPEEKKRKRLKEFFERVARLSNPLYTRLARLIQNPAVQKIGMRSPDALFDDLSKPGRRIHLLREMADLRHGLVVESKGSIKDRTQALDDLSTFLRHASYLLVTQAERAEFQDIYSRIEGAKAVLQSQDEKREGENSAPSNESVEAEETVENIRLFLEQSRGRERVLRGKEESLQQRLVREGKKGKTPNVFGILGDGLRQGDWVDTIAGAGASDDLKHTCIMIALEEAAILYKAIAADRCQKPDDLVSRMKLLFTQSLRKMTGDPQSVRTPFEAEHEAIVGDYDNQKKRLDAAERVASSDVDELLLLHAYLKDHGSAPDLSDRDIESYRKKTEYGREELEEAENRERSGLERAVRDVSIVRAAALKNADLDALLSALAMITEEQGMELRRKRILGKRRQSVKEEHWIAREPEDAFSQRCKEEFEKNVFAIVDGQGTREEKDARIEALTVEYERTKDLRNILHSSQVSELETRILSVVESSLRAEAARVQEQYFQTYLKGKIEQKTEQSCTLENLNALFRDKDWSDVPLILDTEERATLMALDRYKNCALDFSNSYESAKIFIRDFRALREEAEHPERVEQKEKERKERSEAFVHTAETLTAGIEPFPDVNTARESLEEVEKRIRVILPEYLFDGDAFGLTAEKHLKRVIAEAGETLSEAERNDVERDASLSRASAVIAALRECASILEFADEEPVVLSGNDGQNFAAFVREGQPDLPVYAWAVYDRRERRIVLNGDRIQHAEKEYKIPFRKAVIAAERRHAFNHAVLTVFPNVFQEFHSALRTEAPEAAEQLDEFGPKWVRREGLTEEVFTDEVVDELLSKQALYAEIQKIRQKNPRAQTGGLMHMKEEKLQEMLLERSPATLDLRTGTLNKAGRRRLVAEIGDDEQRRMHQEQLSETRGLREDIRGLSEGLRQTEAQRTAGEGGAEAGEGGEAEPPAGGAPPPDGEGVEESQNGYIEGAQHAGDLRTCDRLLIKIQSFLDHNPGQRKSNYDLARALREKYEQYNAEFTANPTSESDQVLGLNIKSLRDELERIEGKIDKFDAEQLDTRSAPPQGRGVIRSIWESIEWMSVNDFIAIGKAIAEDMKRQFQRRQQGKIGRVGEKLTDWIGKVPIVKSIPYLNNLASEFHRRDKRSEVEEVQQWQDALKDDDSYILQDMLHSITPGQKDKMKAILNLLAERGRIDWDDKEFWETLNRVSIYSMPILQCERDENLREEWLRKLIEDIYGDKDHYRNWKNSNSSNIVSEKNKFSPEVDRISNLSGGLANECRKQLMIFLDIKRQRESGNLVEMPSAVQPHLYEKVLHYSIENGKMSMEEKFYYLVQGIAEGLISRDRLAVLAGEGGEGLLQIFPFIDYFYGKNNTMGEIKSLADRLWETTDKNSSLYCKPGLRTTLWLELEVGRMDSVQQRLSKGFSKQGQRMDHDDMHFFLPRVDQKSLVQMMGPAGGGRPQFSPESWENGYVGFSSMLKSLGMVIRLEEDRDITGVKFTTEDANIAIQTVVNYLTMDSILTNRTTWSETAEARQSKLDRNRLNTRSPVVAGGRFTTMQAKNEVDRTVREILDRYGLLVDPEIRDYVLYDTYGNEKKNSKRTQGILEKFHKRLTEAVHSRGLGMLKDVLKNRSDAMFSHAANYTYNNVKRTRLHEEQAGIAPMAP